MVIYKLDVIDKKYFQKLLFCVNIQGATLFINEPNEQEILGYFVVKDGLKIEFRNISTTGRLFQEGQKTSWLKELDYPNSKRRIVAIPYMD